MNDLTIVNPTKNSFPLGSDINASCHIGLLVPTNPEIGSGQVVTFTPDCLSGNGSYPSGQWAVSLKQNPDQTWAVNVSLTGSEASYSRDFTASCSADTGGSHGLKFTQVNDAGTSVTLEQDNGGVLSSGKITLSASWAPVSLYFMNS
jgi:hypothetical protein